MLINLEKNIITGKENNNSKIFSFQGILEVKIKRNLNEGLIYNKQLKEKE